MNSAYSYYEILNVSAQASDMDIKRAYHLMAKRYHPDLHPHNRLMAERRLKMVNEAYENLKNRETRANYNRRLRLKAENDNRAANKEKSFMSQIAEILWPEKAKNKN